MRNAHTIAWRILHAELRRRMALPHNGFGIDPEVENFARLYQQAREEGISDLDIMIELAGFAAAFALMTRNPVGVAQQVSRSVTGGWLTTRPSLARLVPTP